VISELRLAGGCAVTLKVSPRARVMRLRVDPRTGAVLLTVPRRVSQKKALEWAAGHQQWIEKALADMPAAAPIAPGTMLPLYGLPRRVEALPDRPRRIVVEEDRIMVGGPSDGLEARVIRWLKRHAAELLAAESREYAARIGVKVAKISVGDPLSRWGSCSSSGAIRYSWRLILAPEFVRRATVAHEVAHLVHMNHGPDFHALGAELFEADPAPARLWLRREGAGLHRIGRRA
jgi:predicted metal-dependent hydrolase